LKCPVCNEAKMVKPQATRTDRKSVTVHDKPEVFGDIITCDTLFSKGESASFEGAECANVMYDLGTHHAGFYDQATKSETEATVSLQHFAGTSLIKLMYSDNAPELIAAAVLAT